MSEVYYNTLITKYVNMYVDTMNGHLNKTSYKEYEFLDLHRKANTEIISLVSLFNFMKKINVSLNFIVY